MYYPNHKDNNDFKTLITVVFSSLLICTVDDLYNAHLEMRSCANYRILSYINHI